MKQRSITMKDVARLAGVSVGTVSRVINKEKGLKKTTLEKVEKAIKSLNYVPDIYARGMKTSKTDTIALILPTIWHPFFSEFAFHVERILSDNNYKLLLCNTDGAKKDIEYITMLQQNKVDGIIAITYNRIEDYLASNIPFVSIDRTYSDKNIVCVSSDNKTGGQLAGQKLLEKGCQHLAFIGSHNETTNETKNRRIYFENYLKSIGKNCQVFDIEEPFEDFSEQLEKFFSQNPNIDGIFAINDFTALDTIAVLERMNKRVPDDVQVIGYDGIRMAQHKPYPVSTIKQPIEEMAQAAIKVLLAIINGEPYTAQTILPITYIESETTKN